MASVAARKKERVLPPRHGGGRQKYGTAGKTVVAVRPPEHMFGFLQRQEKLGYSRSEMMLKIAGVGMDAMERLDLEWWEIEKLAAGRQITPGQVLAELALEALGPRPKPKR